MARQDRLFVVKLEKEENNSQSFLGDYNEKRYIGYF
jgi:hypothetical protein